MNTERPIHLDLGMPSAGAFGLSTNAEQQKQPSAGGRDGEQLQGDAQRLRDLVASGRQAAPAAALATDAAETPVIAGGMFGLFGAPVAASALAQPAQPSALPADVNAHLAALAQRLLVSDGSNGRRAVQIQLDSGQFPGVVLDMCEDGGQLLATFTCSAEATRERLSANAQWLADGLAERLLRPCCVRVQTDDPEDPCVVQASAGDERR